MIYVGRLSWAPVVAGLISGCARPCPPAAAPVLASPVACTPAPAPVAPPVPVPPPARPLSVECTTTSPDHAGDKLSEWKMGGPSGASFNWYGSALRCTVTIRAACGGKGRVALRVGTANGPVADVAFESGAAKSVDLDVAAKVWERALEPGGDFVYERLLVVARLDGHCIEDGQAPGERGEGVHVADAFIGGFGGGE